MAVPCDRIILSSHPVTTVVSVIDVIVVVVTIWALLIGGHKAQSVDT